MDTDRTGQADHGGDSTGSGQSVRRAVAFDHGEYRFLAQLARPYRWSLLGILLLMALQSVVMLAMAWVLGKASGALLGGLPVAAALAAVFALVLARIALGYAIGMASIRTSSLLVADTCTRLFDHLQSLPLRWHQDRQRGAVLSLITQDVMRLGYFITGTVTPIAPLLLTCAGAFVVLVALEPVIGLAVAVLVPCVIVLLRLAGRRVRPLAYATAEEYAANAAIAEQGLAMLDVVKAFSGETAESARFHSRTHRLRDLQIRLARAQAIIMPAVQVLSVAAVLLLLWFCSRKVAAGSMTPSDLVGILLYGLLLTQPVSQLAGVYGQAQAARGTARRVMDVLADSPEPDDGTREIEAARGELAFEGVHFAYPGRGVVLDGLDLHVRAGETIAITGPNGAGKSTLAHLLLRFTDPQAGRILLDGIDLRELTLRSLRSQIGLVSQNVLLFNASLADNIAYGRVDASRAQIERAAHAARAHEFVQGMPDGYDTVIGDQGIRLSGGQKQRISLARALLKDPAVLVLDEATAMFDPQGEREFIAESAALLRQRTVLLITHRPASLALADRVLRLEQGRLVEIAPGGIRE